MKLFLFLLLLVNISFGQVVQEIYLCESMRTEYTYYIFNQQSNLKWTTPYGVVYSSSVTVNWQIPGTYTITAEFVDESNCNDQKRIIIVKVYECNESAIYFPNAFTPNDDVNNKFFDVKGYNIKSFHMLIYNRWGELIYETYSLEDKWDGYYEGRLVQLDVYVYTALWQDIKEKWGSKTGTVTVLY